MEDKQSTEEKKGKGGRKPKYNYTSDEFLAKIEALAKQGFTDKEIALSIGLSPQKFYEKKGAISEISDTLACARANINAAVRSAFLKSCLGRVIKHTEYVKQKCSTCGGKGIAVDETGKPGVCPDCGGTGWIRLTDRAVVSEQEIAPSVQAQVTWLMAHDEEWKKSLKGRDEGDMNKLEGIDIEVVFNDKKDLELQDKTKRDET